MKIFLLVCISLLVLLANVSLTFGKTEDVIADAERRRAAVSPEELAKQLAENTITDADLLPTRPPMKDYVMSGEPEFGLLLSPGIGKSCNLKKFPNLIQFLRDDAKYYPELIVDYQVATDPRLKFYATKAQRDSGLIHGEFMTEDDILALLQNGPDETKEPILSMPIGDWDPEPAELRHNLYLHGIQRSEVPDENHSSQVIFKPDFVPIDK